MGRSRISRRGAWTCLGGGVDLRRGHFLVKMCVKTKELAPVEGRGGRAPENFVCRSANGRVIIAVS